MGIATGLDLDALVDAGAWISQLLGRQPVSRVSRALLARRSAAAPRSAA
jgi:hydroxymethylglutaryl-CoA lyase